MARTSISLPDDFVERLEPLKAHINISQVCHAALEVKVQTYEAIELALSDEDVMRGLIERLKIQKAEASDRSYAQGLEDGKYWAIREATYQDLDRWGIRHIRIYRVPETAEEFDAPSTRDPAGNPLIEILVPDSPTAEQHFRSRGEAADREGQPFEFRAYRTGFLDAVQGIWSKVKAELN